MNEENHQMWSNFADLFEKFRLSITNPNIILSLFNLLLSIKTHINYISVVHFRNFILIIQTSILLFLMDFLYRISCSSQRKQLL
jgi:hypothetical protein